MYSVWYNTVKLYRMYRTEVNKVTAIKRIREQHGISQREFAEALGVTQGAVSHWELGRRKPDINDLVAIARFLNCTIDDLLKEV